MNDRYRYGEQRPGNPTLAYTQNTQSTQLRDIQKTLPLRVLSPEQWTHWQSYGYVVVKQAVPPDQVQRTCDYLWAFQDWHPHDPSSWNQAERRGHAMQELNGSGMVEAYPDSKVRMAQYIAFTPAHQADHALRQTRVASWRERTAPKGFAFPGDPRGWEQKRQAAAVLTPLGERILGFADWSTSR